MFKWFILIALFLNNLTAAQNFWPGRLVRAFWPFSSVAVRLVNLPEGVLVPALYAVPQPMSPFYFNALSNQISGGVLLPHNGLGTGEDEELASDVQFFQVPSQLLNNSNQVNSLANALQDYADFTQAMTTPMSPITTQILFRNHMIVAYGALANLYIEAFLATGNPEYAQEAHKALDRQLRANELNAQENGVFSPDILEIVEAARSLLPERPRPPEPPARRPFWRGFGSFRKF